ncbi:MAG TPA: hypothetical protein VH333_10070, partial [Pseudonocardiaceae bacterium]|nr:hypothetical protein [Pseudonocardiaceae bacterium]
MPATFVSNPPNRWHRRSRGSTTLRRGHFVTDADAGVPILPQQFGDTLKLVVEIAWGANLTAASSTWVWTDITRDVRVDDAVSITLGKANEATDTQPAGIKFSVDDSASKYSTSPLGPNWPNVQFNTPIRARIVNSGVSNSRFVGYATSFVPGWNVKGNVATASISASGILQRLGQGQVPSRSCLWYSVNNTAPSMWWPLEEGTGSAQGIPAVGSGTMSFFQGTTGLGGLAGSAQFGGDTSLAGADRELTLTAANAAPYMVATVDSAVSAACATSFTLSWYAKFTDDATQGANFLAYMSGSKVLDVSFTTSTTFLIWDETGATSSTATTADVFGQWHQWVLLVEKSGSNVVAILFKDSNAYLSATFTGVSMTGPIQFVFEAPFTSGSSLSLSHVTLHPSDATSSVFTTVNSSKGHPGETVTDRISRITSERGITSTVSGSSVQTMGPQTSGNTVDLLRQCEQVDGGVLYDGQAAGFSYLN